MKTGYYILFIVLLGLSAIPTQARQRIASLNLCTDQLLLQLADREQIASVSYLAADPEWSPVAHLTEGLHLNHGRAEEIIARDPDLIVNSRFSAGPAVSLLERLGHEVITFDFPASIDDSIGQIRRMAELLDRPQRGEALISAMQERIERHLPALQDRDHSTLFLASNGISFGTGTLRHHFIASLGWENLAATLGLQGTGRLNLETVIAADPDFLLVNQPRDAGEPLAHHLLRHPALAHLAREGRYLVLPDALFECAGPPLAAAYARLAAQLPALPGDQQP